MKKFLSVIAASIVVAVSAPSLLAQAGSFVDVNPDSRSMGMANSSIAVEPSAFAMWNNTSALVLSPKKFSAGASYTMWQPGASNNNVIAVAANGRLGKFVSLSAGVKYFSYSSFELMDDKGVSLGQYTPKEMTAGIGIGVRILPILSLSANVNYVLSDLGAPKKGNAVTTDYGATLDLKVVRIGISANNIGSKLNYGGEKSYALPANMKVGVGTVQNFAKNQISVNLQGGMTFEHKGIFASLGAEYMYNNLIAVRAGYHYGDKTKVTPSYASVGLGVRFIGIDINAFYLIATGSSSPMKNTFGASLSYAF